MKYLDAYKASTEMPSTEKYSFSSFDVYFVFCMLLPNSSEIGFHHLRDFRLGEISSLP